METIAAVATGGTAMSGGRGKIIGTFMGVLMFKMISNIPTAKRRIYLPKWSHKWWNHSCCCINAKLPKQEKV